jgi:alpha-tubulin suppressor-like RCC1 family protein
VGGLLFKEIAAGAQHNLALAATGQLYAWGANGSSQLGLGSTTDVNTPTAVSSGTRFVHVAAGGLHSLALAATGQLYAWGSNIYGQLGIANPASPTIGSTPAPVPYLPALTQAVAGESHSLALTATGTAYAWGSNYAGQLSAPGGILSYTPNYSSRLITAVPLLTQLAAGRMHSLALAAGGVLYTWGSNYGGELGQGFVAPTYTYTPSQEATGSTAWATLGTGCQAGMSLARTASGLTFASAGPNTNGELGDGTTSSSTRFDRLSPLVSLQPLPVLAAAPGAGFALAPNPASGQATALGLPAGTSLAVYDALGLLARTTAGATLEVSGLAPGVYVVRATAPGQPPRTARLAVQ